MALEKVALEKKGVPLTVEKLEEAMNALYDAREAYRQFQSAWREVGGFVGSAYPWLYERVRAYPGWDGSRDVGAGQDMTAWMDEVEDTLSGADDDDES